MFDADDAGLLGAMTAAQRDERVAVAIVWTSPSGRMFTTAPGGTLFFPRLAVSTGAADPPPF